jgi:formylglycine-generating enzyme required for sulfatase activity
MIKKLPVSFFSLLLFAAATTTATAQAKPKLAVFVVGIDDWKRGDVLAHIVGEELNRDKTYQVVTRSGAVQVKLKAMRRSGRADACQLHAWGVAHGVANVCLITTLDDRNFSAYLFDVSSTADAVTLRSGSSITEGWGAVDLKQLAWSLTGELRSACAVPYGCYTEPSVGLDMVYVAGGTFTMGCVPGRDDLNGHTCRDNEFPAHSVSVGSFWIGKYEVTQGQWEAVMGNTRVPPDELSAGSNRPIYNITCREAHAFCDSLSARTGKTYRLPTEAEWEYAARGGISCNSRGYVYSGSNIIDNVGWYQGNSGINGGTTKKRTHDVGTKQGNELGIFDMSGNIFEMCGSEMSSKGYKDNKENIFVPAAKAVHCVCRGDDWNHELERCRLAYRHYTDIDAVYYPYGFRVV